MKNLGFTLAEVLITLVIIGVIAAMTVPTLMNNTNAQEYRSALKKAISGLNQALTLHYALDGSTASDYSDADDLVQNVFKVRMSTVDSTTFTLSDCTVTTGGNNVFTTADGMKFCVQSNATGQFKGNTTSDSQNVPCNSYNTIPCLNKTITSPTSEIADNEANLYIDVNGDRKPNTLTTSSTRPKDGYRAMIYSQKVVPWGAAAQEVMFDKQVSTN